MTTRIFLTALYAFEYAAGCALLLATASQGSDIADRPRRYRLSPPGGASTLSTTGTRT